MADIFIGYRRDDAPGSAGRLYDRLIKHYGHRHVFRDVDAIPAGTDFVERVEAALDRSTATLVVIGPSWTTITDDDGNRRLDDEDDYVRTEVELALARADHKVIPVLVDGAHIPTSAELPDSIGGLATRDAFEIRNTRFDSDVGGLIDEIGGRPSMMGWARSHKVGAAAGALAMVGGLVVAGNLLIGGDSEPLTGDFNVADAEFSASQDTDQEVAAVVSESVFQAISQNLSSYVETGDLQNLGLAGPSDIGALEGQSFADRTTAAADLAVDLNADVVLYGNLDTTDGVVRFDPEFYLSDRNLTNAEELAGGYGLATVTIPVADPVAVTRQISDVMNAQAEALTRLVVGLSHYGLDEPETALAHFREAEKAWVGAGSGKEVVFHLMGNAAGQLGPEHWPEAREFYDAALDIDPGYARSLFGQNELSFQENKGPNCGSGSSEFREDHLRDVSEEFQRITEIDAPPLSFLDVRAEVEIARISLCLAVNGAAPAGVARSQLETVIADHGDNPRLRSLIGNSYEALAGAHLLESDPAAAIDAYRSAADLAIDTRDLAQLSATIAWIYECRIGDTEAAAEEYAQSREYSLAAGEDPLPERKCDA